jgi:hypothetical protein
MTFAVRGEGVETGLVVKTQEVCARRRRGGD